MDGTAIKAIQQAVEPRVLDIGGVPYVADTSGKVFDVRKPEPAPDALGITTLTGFVDYIKANVDQLSLEEMLVHVSSPTTVGLVGKLTTDRFRKRYIYAGAACQDYTEEFFDTFHAIEAFVIGLQSRFTDAGDRAAVLQVVGNVKEEQVKISKDDGVTQTVSASSGIVRVQEVEVPNPVTLAPYRTFPEVDQPPSLFVLRLKAGGQGQLPVVALFEADGGKWQGAAMANVAGYLTSALAEIGIKILA